MPTDRLRRMMKRAPKCVPSNHLSLDDAAMITIGQGAEARYGLCPLTAILDNPHAVRTHSKRQVRKIGRSMEVAGPLSPPVIDEVYMLLAGHGRLSAARQEHASEIPVVQVFGLSAAQKRAFLLADNRCADEAGLDRLKLAQQLPDLALLFQENSIELTDTGFEIAELDELLFDMEAEPRDEEDQLDLEMFEEACALNPGSLLQLGDHKLLIGDARSSAALQTLMIDEVAEVAFLDPPFNVPARAIGGRGGICHRDFTCGFGEMSRAEFVAFLAASFEAVAQRCKSGSIVFSCIDAQHVRDMLEAADEVFQAYLTLVVWNKTNAGQGGLYRNQHELIGVFRVGDEQHQDNVQKGRFGRNRSNVWTYPGVNTFRAGRMEDLACHPTVKPTRMVADALKDVSKRGAIVLDTFAGSGTTILAAEKTGRRARAMEIDPHYAQAAARRWEKLTGRDAIDVASGLTLDELVKAADDSSKVSVEGAPNVQSRTRTRART